MQHGPQTLTQYLLDHLGDHPDQKDMVMIMADLATIGKLLSRDVGRAGVGDIIGQTTNTNTSGETQAKLDVRANELCKAYLKQTGHFAALASEEEDGVVDMGDAGSDAQYVIAFDPLDGSRNIDVNVSVGTIFSVYTRRNDVDRTSEEQFLRAGRDQVLAGYILYGSSTVLVFSFGDGVHECTLDPTVGEFFVSREHIRIPESCTYFSTNSTYTTYLRETDQQFIVHVRDELGASDRHIGSMLADVHRNMLKGGVYMYFANNKKDAAVYVPKIRMVYEINPLSFLVEQAGGLGSDGQQNVLDKKPQELHERSVIVLGNTSVVQTYQDKF